MDRDRTKQHKTAVKEDRIQEETILGVVIPPEIAKIIKTIKTAMRAAAVIQVITALITIMNAVREEMKDRIIDSRKVDREKLLWMSQWFKRMKASVKNSAVSIRTRINVQRKTPFTKTME